MATKKTYFIDSRMNDYLHEQLYKIIYLEDQYMEYQREADAFRGVLDVLHHMNKINTPTYAFLSNFVRWMENEFCGFSWEQKQAYRNLHEVLYEDMERDGWFENDDDAV